MIINITLSGVETLKKRLEGIRARSANLSPVMDKIGRWMVDSVHKNFDSQGRPTPWKPQKTPSKTGRILYLSGSLYNAIRYTSGSQSARVYISGGKASKYAKIHQHGGSTGRSYIPARPYLMIQEEDEVFINRVLADYVMGRTG